ncbi:MAG: hypothetical protein J6B87_02760 [Clostridia bacterium]|nr:hypothetical protein [Clostridia bacterium]
MKNCKECCKDITEEEYKLFNGYCKKCSESPEQEYSHHKYVKFTKVLAIFILIASIIGGIILGDEFNNYYEFNTFIMFASWLGGAISFSIIYGIANIVENTDLLNKK